ncbi:helix-turn-helix domain-containing protein [Hymenobacter algoricola]|uniref:Helix-turn-helix domain-containing protein n=1 Tax=Hymenobacter algoricola TaxID=486267 RepID=A0ABP7MQW2_9BACT
MHIQSFPPVPALATYVEQYCLWDDEATPQTPVLHPVFPGLVNGLNVLYGEPFETVTIAGNEVLTTPGVEMIGMVTERRLYLRQTGRVGVLGVYFQPTGFFRLFGVPMSAVTDATLELDSVAGQFARELRQRVGEAGTPAQRLAVAEELLLRQLRRVQPASEVIARVATWIRGHHGQVSVEALAHAANLSRRQLERRFWAEVGTTPKLYARIARFNHVFQLVEHTSTPDWLDVSHQCGYFDQAHFIREFKHFTGESPGGYFQHYNDFARFFWAR